ncbi:hypothetical protein ACFY8B_35095 [Streptomyces sp. NPDC012751]|uniref:hypothetical protein n=1 Tax=Streptomyces sp. NPDC012751 TaxID=3364846 RepID=UPI003675F139
MLRTARSRTHRAAVAVTCVTLSAGAALAAPASASAAPPNVLVSCTASGQVHFNPGVQLIPRPQHVSYEGQDGPCNDNSGYSIRSGKLTASFDGVSLSCLHSGSSGTGRGTGTIDWTDRYGNTGRSIVNAQIDSSTLNTGHVSGTVSEGLFEGHSFSGTFNTSLAGGAFRCTIGAPAGGLKDAAFTGDYSIN